MAWEPVETVLTRVLANCRVRMDKRRRKAGAGVEPSPGSLPRETKGGTSLAGEHSGAEGAATPLAFHHRVGRDTRDKTLPVG